MLAWLVFLELKFRGEEWWREKESNLRRHTPPDLQSGPFGRLGISPHKKTHTLWKVELEKGIEPPTCGLQNRCSTN